MQHPVNTLHMLIGCDFKLKKKKFFKHLGKIKLPIPENTYEAVY